MRVIVADEAVRGRPNVVLVTAGSPWKPGIAVSIGKLLSILAATGASVRLITCCEPDQIKGIETERITRLPYRGDGIRQFSLGQIECARALRRLHREQPIDVAFFAFGRDLAVFPVVAARWFARQVVLRSDGRPSLVVRRYLPGAQYIRRAGFRVTEEIVYRLVDLLLTENHFMIEDNGFSQYGAVDTGPLFLDLDRFTPTTPVSQRPYDLCFIGRLAEEKGILDLLAALPIIHRTHPAFKTLICGTGPCRAAAVSAIDKAGLSDEVTLTGWIDHDEVAQYLNQSRMLVLPSQREGLPNIVLEAMACGTLVLARPVGGIPGVLVDGLSGYHIRSPGSEGIHEAVNHALAAGSSDPCRTSALSLIESEFSKPTVILHYPRLFLSLGPPGREIQ